jgi:hypothetical protein
MSEPTSRPSLLSILLQRFVEPGGPVRVTSLPEPGKSGWPERQLQKSKDRARAERRELQLKEAEWIWNEMEDFVRLIQRYRGLFITAVFVSVGWLLSQALATAPTSDRAAAALEDLRKRVDIAAVLCLVPLLTTLFAVLMLEAQSQVQSLARYRFLIGYSLGEDNPAWRWERWKEVPEGSTLVWTAPSNVYFTVVAITLPIGALWFALPAVQSANSLMLWMFWSFSASVTASLLIVAVVIGWRNRNNNGVASRPSKTWEDLWPPKSIDPR